MTLFLIEILAATMIIGQAPAAPAYPKQRGPSSPERALAEFKLAPGLRIELAAREPQVQSPVAMAFDERGRLFVVEMLDYPTGPAKGQPPAGRIVRLEDRDGDGFFETSTVFADGLLFANGLLPWRDGLIVTAAPNVLYLQDLDGDGRADRRTVWFEGFAEDNPQLRVSHPILGIDNWVYVANGLRGGKIRRAGDTKSQPIDISGMDFRFDPTTLQGEAVSGMGQFGNTIDDWGNRFVCDNRHHLRQVVLEQRYLRANPFLVPPGVLEDISDTEIDSRDGAGAPVFPLSRNWTTSNLHAARFTAACGVFIYRETLLPPRYRGAAFTCEPTGNLVHCEILRPHGATLRSRPDQDKVEFLATPDDWFRPVFLATGWDGALYVVDMYRAVIEHPEWMPPELRHRPDLWLGKERGRIWRIVPQGSIQKRSRPPLEVADARALARTLSAPEAWSRTTAQRLLLQQSPVPALIAAVRDERARTTSPQARVHASWLLKTWSAIDKDVEALLDAELHPRVLENALRICEGTAVGAGLAVRHSRHPDARVRFQAALSLCFASADVGLAALTAIARQDNLDAWTRAAVCLAARDGGGHLLLDLLRNGQSTSIPSSTAGRQALLRLLAETMGSRNDSKIIQDSLAAVLDDRVGAGSAERTAVVHGIAVGLSRRGQSLVGVANALPASTRSALDRFFAAAERRALDEQEDIGARMQAVQLLAHAPAVATTTALTQLANQADALGLSAIRALAARSDAGVADALLRLWSTALPARRRELADALLRRPQWVDALLVAVGDGKVAAADLDVDVVRRLLKARENKLDARTRQLLAAALPPDRKQVYEKYKACLTLPGDLVRGREVFRKHCATCHRIGGVGVRVGPEISDTRTKTKPMLLFDIVDPNAAIDANYIGYQVTTTSGRLVTGIVVAETASSVTLSRADNQTEVVLRQDIEQLRSSGRSLMPEGLEKEIPPAAMADLLAFLKDWRYVDAP